MSRSRRSFRLGMRRMRSMPPDTFIYHALCDGRSIEELASELGMSRKSLALFIHARNDRWKKAPPKRLNEDERRVIVTREAYVGNAYRMVPVSLPRISMHVLALSEVRHG